MIAASAVGWRFWLLRPDEHLLRAPYERGPTAWPGPEMAAVCEIDPRHESPVVDCECGVYCDPRPDMTLARIERQARDECPVALADHRIVMGRVELANAVRFDWSAPSRIVRVMLDAAGFYELRAASARIIDLTVIDARTMTATEAAQLVAGLRATYGVPVSWAFDPKPRQAEARVSAAMRSLEPARVDPA